MDGVQYRFGPHDLSPSQVEGFFVGWPKRPGPDTLLRLMSESTESLVAFDRARVVGYATALSDRVLFSAVTSLEVLPEYQGRGVGSELMRRMIDQFSSVYATDLVCDDGLAPFYERVGMRRLAGMGIRRYALQGGAA